MKREQQQQQEEEDLKIAELAEQEGYRVQGFRKRGTGVVAVPAASDALLTPAPSLERLVRGMLPAELSCEQARQRLAMYDRHSSHEDWLPCWFCTSLQRRPTYECG